MNNASYIYIYYTIEFIIFVQVLHPNIQWYFRAGFICICISLIVYVTSVQYMINIYIYIIIFI